MPEKSVIRTEAAPAPFQGAPYNQAIVVGELVFTAGQLGLRPDGSGMAGETIEEQTERTLENVKAILAAAGASMADVVKATVHLSDLSLFARYNEVYARYFPDPKPVRTTVGSDLLGIMVEIDVVAYVGGE